MRLSTYDVRRGERVRVAPYGDEFGVFGVVGPPLTAPNGTVMPWDVHFGPRRYVSLALPVCMLSGLDCAQVPIEFAMVTGVAAFQAELRRRVVDRDLPLRSNFVDEVSALGAVEVTVNWFDEAQFVGTTAANSGEQLASELLAPPPLVSGQLIEGMFDELGDPIWWK